VLLLAIAAGLGGALFLYSRKADAAATDSAPPTVPATPATLDDLFARYGVPPLTPRLLKAICIVESNLNPNAVRNNPPRDVSVGLGQVLCIPDANGYCTNALNVDGWQGMTFEALKDPETNLYIASQILAWNIQQFGFPRGVAVYNSWSARTAPLNGPFPNQDYVNRVLSTMEKLP
jgi:soluble lytic murein transglycosylase-like protein